MNFCKNCSNCEGSRSCSPRCIATKEPVDLVKGGADYASCYDRRYGEKEEKRIEDCPDFNPIDMSGTVEATQAVMKCSFSELSWWERLRYPSRKG